MAISLVYNWLKYNQISQCLLCLDPGRHGERYLCDACHADLPWMAHPCPLCALPMSASGPLCGQCQVRRPPYAQIIAPFSYSFPLDALIPAFKHQGRLAYGRLLSLLMADAVRYHYAERAQALPDCLIAMPLHRSRLARRGFNQAQELARPLASKLGLELPGNLLHRTRATPPQQGLAADKRRQNLLGAFVCPRPMEVQDRHVALVDDVVTTGSTVEEATRTLISAGAASVSIWCAARTP